MYVFMYMYVYMCEWRSTDVSSHNLYVSASDHPIYMIYIYVPTLTPYIYTYAGESIIWDLVD